MEGAEKAEVEGVEKGLHTCKSALWGASGQVINVLNGRLFLDSLSMWQKPINHSFVTT